METKQQIKAMSILMLPHLAHGHASPYFELAKRLSNKGFHIYFCSTPICLEFIKKNHNSLSSSSSNIQLIDLQLPSSFHQELPPHYHSTQNLPPHLLNTLTTAFDNSKPAFFVILKTLRPDLVIYDLLQPWAAEAACELNIETVMFLTFGGWNNSSNFEDEEESSSITSVDMLETVNGMTLGERLSRSFAASKILLIKTSKEIAGKKNNNDHKGNSNNASSSMIPPMQERVSVGTLVQKPHEESYNNDGTKMIMDWLSKKEASSIVFVSFGSECFLSKQEMEEMAYGLELSNVGFIWVVRFHGGSKTSIHEALPEGFLDRIEGRGMVLEDWSPQAQILTHASIGGFVSHCGWSSTLEAMVYGVPIIAIPMRLDQPMIAKLVVEIGVGIEVPRKNKKFMREEVASVIRRVVVEEEGEEVRRKAKELSERLKEKEDEEFDEAVKKLVQLVHESRNSAVASKET